MNYLYKLSQGLFIFFVLLLFAGCTKSSIRQAESVDILDPNPLAQCVGGSVKQVSKGNEVTINCELKPIRALYLISEPAPGVSFAKVQCQCNDNAGVLNCPTCTCQADAQSDCKSWLAACEAAGHEALGSGEDIGICNK